MAVFSVKLFKLNLKKNFNRFEPICKYSTSARFEMVLEIFRLNEAM